MKKKAGQKSSMTKCWFEATVLALFDDMSYLDPDEVLSN